MAIDDSIASLLEDLKKSGLVLDVALGSEFTKDQEVFTVSTMVVLVGESEG